MIALIMAFPLYIIFIFVIFPPEKAVRTLIIGIIDGTFYALIAIGFSIIFGVSKMFKLSVGGYFILGAFTARWLFFATAINANDAISGPGGGFNGLKYITIVLFPLIVFFGISILIFRIYGVKIGGAVLLINLILFVLQRGFLAQYYSTVNLSATIQALFIQSSGLILVLTLRYIELTKRQIFYSFIGYNIVILVLSLMRLSGTSPALYFAILIYSMLFVAAISMLVDRYLLDKARDNPTNVLIITFGIALLIQSILPIITFPENGGFTTFDEAKSRLSLPGLVPKTETFTFLGASIQTLRIIAAIVSIIFLIFTFLFINKSTMGVAMRAVSQDSDAAWLMGINVRKVYMVSTGIGMSLTALGAVLTTTYEAKPGWYVYMGYAPLILAIAVVTLGGLGSIAGTAVAGFIIGIASTTVSSIDIQYSGVVPLVVILIIMLLKPEGLFGIKEDEE